MLFSTFVTCVISRQDRDNQAWYDRAVRSLMASRPWNDGPTNCWSLWLIAISKCGTQNVLKVELSDMPDPYFELQYLERPAGQQLVLTRANFSVFYLPHIRSNANHTNVLKLLTEIRGASQTWCSHQKLLARLQLMATSLQLVCDRKGSCIYEVGGKWQPWHARVLQQYPAW